jgi:hypothetical protein
LFRRQSVWYESASVAVLLALALLTAGLAALAPSDARAFDRQIHVGITLKGFESTAPTLSFVQPAVFDDIADQHDTMDGGLSGGRDERHFDDREFDGAAEFIRDR